MSATVAPALGERPPTPRGSATPFGRALHWAGTGAAEGLALASGLRLRGAG